ncbi:hypothetical protein [Nostoc sp. LEGE 12450]|uniref:hypothetical protein n=1 Tax=Nostoc sp. LEGE 12450 TaxID=1828643 RepID=UPI00187E6B09|nr:hypothetical protein [Nostoc sp. LEGE 12450]MBE8990554.1 hypothetical protein [Nostoc sp. LEGE 12450]
MPAASYTYALVECIRVCVLEESVQKFLESLGKLNRTYLTNLEEKVLSFLESEILVYRMEQRNNAVSELWY